MNNSTSPLEPPLSEVPIWLRWIHGLTVGAIILFSLAANTVALLLVWKYRQLRYWSTLITLGVVLADLVTPLFLHFQAIVSTTAGRWPFGDAGCTVFAYISHWLYYVRWLQTAVIALDRFLIIKYPFVHARWKKRLLLPLVVAGWIVPLVTALPPVAGFGNYRFRSTTTSCVVECFDDRPCYFFAVGNFSVHFTIGALTPTLLYLYLFCFGIFKRKKSIQRLGTQNNINQVGLEANGNLAPQSDQRNPNDDNQAPSTSQEAEVPRLQQHQTTLPQIQNHEPLQTSLSPTEQQRRKRAGTTFAIIFIALLLTQLPLYMLSTLRSTPIYQYIPFAIHLIAFDVYLSVTVLDPIVIMRNKDFRQMFSRLLGERRSSWNDFYPSSTLTNTVTSQHS